MMGWYHAQLTLWTAVLLTVSWASRDIEEIRYRFTSCGRTGRDVPMFGRCNKYYTDINSPLIRDDLYVRIRGGYSGAQGFKVPRAGVYNITVAGAAGGRGLCNPEIGLGQVQQIQVELSPRYELLVLVGQRGLGPCNIDNPPAVCTDFPTLSMANESVECFNQWYFFLNSLNNSEVGEFTLANVGGAGGGGASMVWPRLLGENSNGEVTELPLAISGGGGGSPTALAYRCTVEDLGLIYYLPLDDGEIFSFQEVYTAFLNAKLDTYNPYLGYRMEGVRGFRAPGVLFGVNAGTGGGWRSIAGAPVGEMDGGLLSSSNDFAEGGIDCATLLQTEHDIPFNGMHGGFGGGGGGCGGGGGGGGYTGGSVLWNGIIPSKKIPGSGGHSYYGEAPPANLNVTYIGYSLNTDLDGYVDIVPADCGCAFECLVAEERFECLCPSDSQLAPDQSDCFQVKEIGVQDPLRSIVDSAGFHYTFLNFTEVFIFSIEVNLAIAVPEIKRAARQAIEDTCAIILFTTGQESVILASNPVRGSGTANTIALVEEEENSFVVPSKYAAFLNSSVLITGAVLVSTQRCLVEGMKIGINASINVPEADFEPLDMVTLEEFLSDAPNFARSVLQLNEPPPSPPPTDVPASKNTLVIVLATVVVFLFLLVSCLVVGILVIWECHKRKKKASQTFSGGSVTVTAGFESDIQCENAANIIDTSANDIQHRYEELQFNEEDKPTGTLGSGTEPRYEMFVYNEEGESELTGSAEHNTDHRQLRRLSSKYGISAAHHDFTDYNRQRSETTDWEYPRCNLIYMRELGEGQFGKVLLMKAKGIAGYEGKIPVAVKTLTSTDHEVVRKFMEEVELMKQFTHPNIVSLLGVGSKDEDEDSAPLLILEYMPYGDLQEFLESHRPQEDGEESQITETHFYNFATDVAKALEFLASYKYVHRDVAARNCLVGSGLQIKIADFGLARGVYDKDYYRVAGKAVLPVRWMAPECLLYGIFTTASDVWAYGVLLWEIVVYGELPLEDMKPQEIVEQAQNGTLQHPRPQNCPDVIYDLMCLCHNHDRDQRPSFTEILTTLEAINAGPDITTDSDEPSSPV